MNFGKKYPQSKISQKTSVFSYTDRQEKTVPGGGGTYQGKKAECPLVTRWLREVKRNILTFESNQ